MIRLKRAYDDVGQEDGLRFVVDRVWPRGVKKEALALDGWLRDVAPSDELRRWFGHEPERWDEFVRRYHTELDAKPDAWQPSYRRLKQATSPWSSVRETATSTTQWH